MTAAPPPSNHNPAPHAAAPPNRRGLLDWIEWAGNQLPEPAILFAILAALIFLLSGVAHTLGWSVQPVRIRIVMVEQLDDDGRPVIGADGKPAMIQKLDEDGRPETELINSGQPLRARSLVTSDGVYWLLSGMIRNFVGLPALGLVFVGMLGIGLAEKFGLFAALMRWLAMLTPRKFLTPVIIFIGANSSVASDAGYIILPPLAAALYLAMGRHPIAGLAAVFAGVAGGFGGGFFPTAADSFLAGVATQAAHIIDPKHPDVLATHNWYFKMGSAVIVTLAGWYVTDRIVEPRLKAARLREPDAGEVAQLSGTLQELSISPAEKRGLLLAGLTNLAVVALFTLMVMLPGWPLNGDGVPTLSRGAALTSTPIETLQAYDAQMATGRTVIFEQKPKTNDQGVVTDDGLMVLQAATGAPSMLDRPASRWSQVIVPLIFFAFALPGIAFGLAVGTCKGQKDVVEGLYHGIRNIVPVLAIAFFMGQFVNCFEYSGLDRMLAFAGGSLLVRADVPVPVLIVLFVLLVIAGDFALSGMLSKYGVMAPIFIPMFMMVGISAELTTAAYRIGDSVVNVITPLNSYLLIILAVLQRYKKESGLGTLISLMLPYSVLFFIVWTGFLLAYFYAGLPLGPGSPLHYAPPH